MELFRKLGIADGVRELGVPADHPFDIAFFTRFSTFEIARGRTPSRAERLEMRRLAPASDQVCEPPHRANQMYVERLMFERAAARPHIRMKFGWSAKSFAQDEQGVTVTIADVQGREETLRTRYVVGCDGGRGMVRRALGIKYGGEAQLMDVFLAGLFTAVHLRVPDMYQKFVGHRRAWMYMAMNPDRASGDDLAQRRGRIHHADPDRTRHRMDEAAIVARVKTAIGADVPVELIGQSAVERRRLSGGGGVRQGPRVHRRRRCPPLHSDRRLRAQHRHRRYLEPRLEARRRAARLGRAGAA